MKRQYSCVEGKQEDHRSSDSSNVSAATGQKNNEDPNIPLPTPSTARRPKGRPLGSKNKPKPVVPINPSDHPLISPYYVLQVPQGADIVRSTTHFCQQHNIGLCILNAIGAVTNVNIRQPPTIPGNATTYFCGPYNVVSISATIFGNVNEQGSFSICVAGQHGQVFGGIVVGPLVAATPMKLLAVKFSSPSYHVLQDPNQEDTVINAAPEAVGGGHNQSSLQVAYGGGGIGNQSYWAMLAARQLQPPPY